MASDDMPGRPYKASLFIVNKEYTLEEHLRYDPRYATSAHHPRIGDIFLYSPELHTPIDNGWWLGAILTDSKATRGWIHPGVIRPIGGFASAIGDQNGRASMDYVSEDTLMLHCHGLCSDVYHDRSLNFHCGSCLVCQHRFMKSATHVGLLVKACQHLGSSGQRAVRCICTHCKHRSYSMAWFVLSLTNCRESDRMSKSCRAVPRHHSCEPAGGESLANTFLDIHGIGL
jgi:hypothetical protein